MPRKGEKLTRQKRGQLLGSSKANKLIDFYNAFMVSKIVDGSSNEVLIGDLAILFKIKGGGAGQTTGSGAYRGEYSPDGNTEFNPGDFAFGDMVRVSPTNAVATSLGGDVIPGVYICVQDAPGETDLPNHPLSPGGETAFWQLIATYPSVTNGCDIDGNTVSRFTDEQDSNA